MTQYSAVVADLIIEDTLIRVDNEIQQLSLKELVPNYLSPAIADMLFSNVNAMVVESPSRRGLNEECMSDVPCLNKDTLMPKELNKETIEVDNSSTIELGLTQLGMKPKKSTLSKRDSLSLSSKPRSLTLASNKKTSLQKSQKAHQSKLQMLQENTEIDDPQIERLRKITHIRLQDKEQYQKIQAAHAKSFKDKSQALSSLGLNEPMASLTQDYDTQYMKSVVLDEKIRLYSVRPGLSAPRRLYKDGNETYVPPATKVTIQRYSKQKQPSIELKTTEMPLFPQQSIVPSQEGFKSYKLNEYKKHFGRGFSRLNQVSKTIDYGSVKDNTDDIFYEKKHLNDSQEMSPLVKSQLKNNHIPRRLALPRLHGRYRVLDRYEQ